MYKTTSQDEGSMFVHCNLFSKTFESFNVPCSSLIMIIRSTSMMGLDFSLKKIPVEEIKCKLVTVQMKEADVFQFIPVPHSKV